MKKITRIFIIFILIIATMTGCSNGNSDISKNVYIGETLQYENIDITVNSISERDEIGGDYSGNKLITISLTLKNNKKKTFDFPYHDIYFKVEDSNERYKVSYGMEYLFGDEIIAGGTKNYEMKFFTPYSYTEKNFIVVFDWGFFSPEKEYFLYMRDGTKFGGEENFDKETTDKEEFYQIAENLQNDVFNIYKEYVYDKITSNMSYSNAQNLVDNCTKQVKTQISTLSSNLDMSNGSLFPKWIIKVRLNDNKTYSLFYIEVELNSSYYCKNKSMGRYELRNQ